MSEIKQRPIKVTRRMVVEGALKGTALLATAEFLAACGIRYQTPTPEPTPSPTPTPTLQERLKKEDYLGFISGVINDLPISDDRETVITNIELRKKLQEPYWTSTPQFIKKTDLTGLSSEERITVRNRAVARYLGGELLSEMIGSTYPPLMNSAAELASRMIPESMYPEQIPSGSIVMRVDSFSRAGFAEKENEKDAFAQFRWVIDEVTNGEIKKWHFELFVNSDYFDATKNLTNAHWALTLVHEMAHWKFVTHAIEKYAIFASKDPKKVTLPRGFWSDLDSIMTSVDEFYAHWVEKGAAVGLLYADSGRPEEIPTFQQTLLEAEVNLALAWEEIQKSPVFQDENHIGSPRWRWPEWAEKLRQVYKVVKREELTPMARETLMQTAMVVPVEPWKVIAQVRSKVVS